MFSIFSNLTALSVLFVEGPMEKFSDFDKRIIARREELFSSDHKLDARTLVDHWPLFAGQVPIANMMARYEILKQTVDVPGHVLEFGCFNGAHLAFIAKCLRFLAPGDMKRVYGFDSFEGLKVFTKEDAHAKNNEGFYKGSESLLRHFLDFHELNDTVHLVKGTIEDTLPVFLQKNPHFIFSYVYLDTDLYSSTSLVLKTVWNRLAGGGVVAFDEGLADGYPGEGQAFVEFFEQHQQEFTMKNIPFARQPMFYIIKK